VATLRHEVGPLAGGEDKLAFDVLNRRMMVLSDAGAVSTAEVCEAVARTGMTAEEWQAGHEGSPSGDGHRRLQVWFTATSGIGVLTGVVLHTWLAGGVGEALRLFGGHDGQALPWREDIAYASAVGFGVRFVLPKAWLAARRLRPDINLLMVIAVAAAIGIGEWFEAATVAFLFALSLSLESWSVGRARRAISALLDLAPPIVRVKREGGAEADTPAAEVAVGTRFIVRPGERVPLAGRIVARLSAVNQAPITGESVPVGKESATAVFAATINGDGARDREYESGRTHDPRPYHPNGRGSAQSPCPIRAMGREVCPAAIRRR
jgi:Cd2+/Zn2+-exporting ATPase